MALVAPRFESIQYDGMNSAAVVAFIPGWGVVSESSGVLYAAHESGNADVTLATGDYLVKEFSRFDGVATIRWSGSADAYAKAWIEGA